MKFRELRENFPWIFEIASSLAGAIGAHWVVQKEGKKELTPEAKKFIRMEAPHFAKNQADEARFAQVIADLPTNQNKDLLEVWLPTLGQNQKADFILTVAEMTAEAEAGKSANWERAITLLGRLARIPDNARRTTWAASMRFIKPREDDYLLVKRSIPLNAKPQPLVFATSRREPGTQPATGQGDDDELDTLAVAARGPGFRFCHGPVAYGILGYSHDRTAYCGRGFPAARTPLGNRTRCVPRHSHSQTVLDYQGRARHRQGWSNSRYLASYPPVYGAKNRTRPALPHPRNPVCTVYHGVAGFLLHPRPQHSAADLLICGAVAGNESESCGVCNSNAALGNGFPSHRSSNLNQRLERKLVAKSTGQNRPVEHKPGTRVCAQRIRSG